MKDNKKDCYMWAVIQKSNGKIWKCNSTRSGALDTKEMFEQNMGDYFIVKKCLVKVLA